jgi:hypothetical protein
MLLPDRVEIELESGSEHCMMYRYTRAEGVCGDDVPPLSVARLFRVRVSS